MTPEEYRQLKAFTRQDGLIMGALWVGAFACFTNMFAHPALSLVFNVLLLCVPVLMWQMVRRYRDGIVHGPLSFRRGFLYAFSVCMYSTLILCVCQWAYFSFLDHGTLFNNLEAMLSMDEYNAMIKAYGVKEEEITELMNALREARPIDLAVSFVSQSFFGSLLCSALVALVCRGGNRGQ